MINPNESAVLWCCLFDNSYMEDVAPILGYDGSAFEDPDNATLWEAFIELKAQDQPVDPSTLAAMSERKHWMFDVLSLIGSMSSAAYYSGNAKEYAANVQESYQRREAKARLMAFANQAGRDGLDVAAIRCEIDRLSRLSPNIRLSRTAEEIGEEMLDSLSAAPSYRSGIPTGFNGLDRIIGGLRGGDLIIVAARTSVGKTAFAVQMSEFNAIRRKGQTLFFTFEMDGASLLRRMASLQSGVNWRNVEQGFGREREFEKIKQAAKDWNSCLHIVNESRLSITKLCSEARRHVREFGKSLIIVDYLQQISREGKVKENWAEVGEFTRSLKELARELDSPVVCLAQLNREADNEPSGFAMLKCLRESGNIEQDADIVIILYRDKKESNVVHCTVAKNRNGETANVVTKFDKDRQRFTDIDMSGRKEPGRTAPDWAQDEELLQGIAEDGSCF